MSNKTKFVFNYFMDYEDGKIAHLEMANEYEVPLNLYADNADEIMIENGAICFVDVLGIGSDIAVFGSEEEYKKSGNQMDSISMIPIGTFPADETTDEFEQSPYILFSGKVLNVEYNSDASFNEPNYCITIETLGMNFKLFIQCDEVISNGNIINGVAWLFGNLEKTH